MGRRQIPDDVRRLVTAGLTVVIVVALFVMVSCLTGCSTSSEPEIVYKPYEVQVPGPCPEIELPARPGVPVMADADTESDIVTKQGEALQLLKQYCEELETIIRRFKSGESLGRWGEGLGSEDQPLERSEGND